MLNLASEIRRLNFSIVCRYYNKGLICHREIIRMLDNGPGFLMMTDNLEVEEEESENVGEIH